VIEKMKTSSNQFNVAPFDANKFVFTYGTQIIDENEKIDQSIKAKEMKK